MREHGRRYLTEGEAVDVVVEVQRGHPQPTTTPWCRRPRPDQASSSTTPQVAGAPWDSKGGEVDAGGRAGGEQLGRRRWRIDAVARRGRKDSRCYGGQRGRVSAAETEDTIRKFCGQPKDRFSE
jgi:hypothetical protein